MAKYSSISGGGSPPDRGLRRTFPDDGLAVVVAYFRHADDHPPFRDGCHLLVRLPAVTSSSQVRSGNGTRCELRSVSSQGEPRKDLMHRLPALAAGLGGCGDGPGAWLRGRQRRCSRFDTLDSQLAHVGVAFSRGTPGGPPPPTGPRRCVGDRPWIPPTESLTLQGEELLLRGEVGTPLDAICVREAKVGT